MQTSTVDFEKRLIELGVKVPEVPPAAGRFVPAVQSGSLIFCSGQGPWENGVQRYLGKVGRDLGVEDAAAAARIAAINCLAEVRELLGTLNGIRRIVQVRGYVACTDSFMDQPKVIDGASRFLLDVFGEAGKHARAAIGVAALPGNIAVEIEMIVEVSAPSL